MPGLHAAGVRGFWLLQQLLHKLVRAAAAVPQAQQGSPVPRGSNAQYDRRHKQREPSPLGHLHGMPAYIE